MVLVSKPLFMKLGLLFSFVYFVAGKSDGI